MDARGKKYLLTLLVWRHNYLACKELKQEGTRALGRSPENDCLQRYRKHSSTQSLAINFDNLQMSGYHLDTTPDFIDVDKTNRI